MQAPTRIPDPAEQPAEASAAPRPCETPCPRCRYDLRGTRPAKDADRLVCPECGLATTWLDVTAPDRVADRWDVEFDHAPRLRAAVVTWVRTFLPSRLWAKVRLEVPIRPARLAWFAAAALAVAHLIVAAAVGLGTWSIESRSVAASTTLLRDGLIAPPPVEVPLSPAQEESLEDKLSRALFLSWPDGGYLVTPRAVGEAVDFWAVEEGVRVDAGRRGAWIAGLVAARPAILEARAKAVRTRARAAAWRAAAFPYSASSLSEIDWAWGPRAATLLMVPALTVLIMPLSFLVLLRRSMHRARVSPAHLLRIGAYTIPPIAWVFSLGAAAAIAGAVDPGAVARWLPGSTSLGILLASAAVWTGVWFFWTWWCFLRRYLKLPHAGPALALMAPLSLAVAVAICFFLIDRNGVTDWSEILVPNAPDP